MSNGVCYSSSSSGHRGIIRLTSPSSTLCKMFSHDSMYVPSLLHMTGEAHSREAAAHRHTAGFGSASPNICCLQHGTDTGTSNPSVISPSLPRMRDHSPVWSGGSTCCAVPIGKEHSCQIRSDRLTPASPQLTITWYMYAPGGGKSIAMMTPIKKPAVQAAKKWYRCPEL